ncbi:MAG: SDR family oxidoreductase [Verrucomicrobia bacterium]|nr:SDR family oxidoreductase [Verrucomicrobiota bacterium]MBV9673618.1 SDR family oxidoreductase [Verrucomicrobiota bacterium]
MKKALVAGALGVTGRALVSHLLSLGDWEVVGLSRRSPEFVTTAKYLGVDLLNRSGVESQLSGMKDITHLFFAALQPAANFVDEIGPNLAMLVNLVETVERSSTSFRKAVLIEGAKFYGAHLGPYKTPAKESDPRHLPPNFYYNQEDYLDEHSKGKPWSWTALRPSCICGFAVGNPMNMATVIAVYAALCQEMKLPFRFPGSTTAYHPLVEMTDANLLAKAIVWAGENERCDREAFNITNGDFVRWESLWPRLAEFFKMECAPPLRLPLSEFMSDKEVVWKKLVKRYNLLDYSFQEAAAWPFAESIFNIEYDVMSDTTKSRQFGFFEWVSTEEMLVRLFSQFKKMRFIP